MKHKWQSKGEERRKPLSPSTEVWAGRKASGFIPLSEPQMEAALQSPPLAPYQRVKNYILNQIKAKTWAPESLVPSENELAKTFGVSRMTANRALRELAAEGIVHRLHGVGTFVAHPKPQVALLQIRSIADEIAEFGGIHTSHVHLLTEEKAATALAEEMGIRPGDPVFHSIIVHNDGDSPVQLSDRYVNPSVAPEYLQQDFTRITPSQYLLGIAPVQEVEHIIEAIMPDKECRRLLKIKSREPCLLIHRRTWSFGQVATKSRLIYPGSRYRLGGRFRPLNGGSPA